MCWTQKGNRGPRPPHSQCRVASVQGVMDSFMESLNRLKEAHEKEVLGLQNKLLELNSERCRDAQRVEELFAKNHQLREQQKALKENLRVLENRLRAGLCDRCMVTQELARKKQLELESAHLQSLQHLCILMCARLEQDPESFPGTVGSPVPSLPPPCPYRHHPPPSLPTLFAANEMNGLREENKILKEEVKRLRNLGDKTAPQAWEGTSEPPSPLPLPSPSSRKGATENPPGVPEEVEEELPGTDKVSSHKTSPVARVSPAASLPEPRALDMTPQCISNQLHSTVAVVRPGSRACPPDSGTANGTPPPSTRSTPPSPTYEHGLPVDSFLRASRPSAIAFETLKHTLQTDRLCLLNRHLSLHLQSPHSSPLASAAAPNSPLPHGPKAREAETWEEPGALVGMQDPRLEGALHLLLVQQHLRARARASTARLRVPSAPEEMPSSPPAGSDSGSSDSEAPKSALSTEAQPDSWHPRSTGQRQETHMATQDCPPDKPLDLSDRGRCRDISKVTGQPLPLSPTIVHTPSPQLPTLSRPLTHSSHSLSNGSTETRAQESEEYSTPKIELAWDTSRPLPGIHAGLTSPGRTVEETGGKPRPGPYLQRPDTDETMGNVSTQGTGPEGKPKKVRAQKPELEQPEESDTSDTKAGLISEASAEPSMPGDGPAEDHLQSQQQKRKRASDLQDKAPKKPSQGKRKPKELLTRAEGPRSPRDMEDFSLSPINSCRES
ncbi:RBBP8 N-terminal-like [Apodemus speciosus]|uniref:RBBP8 N-terminal-like n=1 Tax=Apodemus speciosus TaxID=105296 RepID=A0ABQ0EKF9_APOSI